MTDRLVTHAFRDTDGDIVAIGNPQEPWLQRHQEWAISDILAERHRYFVTGSNGGLRPIDVIDGESGRYLRARADSSTANNLDNLALLDFQPWEIALDNSEVLAVHAALVPHGVVGQVLIFGGDEHDPSNADNGEIFNTRIYDVERNEMVNINSPEADVFCCSHAYLGDGRLFVGGGTEFWRHEDPEHFDMHAQPRAHWSGAKECAVYNLDGTWTAAADMLPEPGQVQRGGGRWYPTLLTLADGRILAVAGHPSLTDGRHGSWMPEIYDPASDTWAYVGGHWIYVDWADVPVERELNEMGLPLGEPVLDDEGNLIELVEFPAGQSRPNDDPDRSWNYLYYPRMFVVPNDRVFLASPNNGSCGWYDPATGLIDEIAIAQPDHGAGFAETNHTAVLLPLLPGDNYTPHVLFMGMQGPRRITLGNFTAETPPQWTQTPDRDWVGEAPLRRHGCATLLPTGDVIFTGGINNDEGSGLPDTDAVLQAEIYRPGINWTANAIDFIEEEWVTTPAASVPRNYHSVALLLPNGRVWTAGSNINGSSGGDNVKEYRIEIYTPEYFHDVNRPSIISAPSNLSYGDSFSVQATRHEQTQRVALMRCGSVTHAWDGDQRYVGLEFTVTDSGLSVTAPPNGNIAPPGPYLLWVIDADNRPCQRASFVLLA